MLSASALLLLLLPAALRAQDRLAPVALDPATSDLVPMRLELVRGGEVRLDPATGTLAAAGAVPGDGSFSPILGFDPAARTLVAVELVARRAPGRITIDIRDGSAASEGVETPTGGAASAGLVLVGFDRASGSLAPMEIALRRQQGSFELDPRVGVLSPPPVGQALLGYDPAAGSLAPVEAVAVRGPGTLEVEVATGRVSLDPSGTGPAAATLSLLGIASDGRALVPVDLQVIYQPGLLTMDPPSGDFAFHGEPSAEPEGLTLVGVNRPTGALMRARLGSAPLPGAYTVNPLAGTVEEVVTEPESVTVSGFLFGGGLDVRQMLKLQDVLEEGGVGGTGASASDFAPGIHGFAEYRWRAFSLGVEAAYSVMDTEIRFPQGLQTGDLRYLEFGGNVKLHVPLEGNLQPYATFAILRVSSEADFELEGLTESRTYEAKRDGIGAGFDYWINRQWGLRVEGLYNTTFEDSDAAEHIRWRLGVTYSADGVGRGADVR
jgi:hypothetical protein